MVKKISLIILSVLISVFSEPACLTISDSEANDIEKEMPQIKSEEECEIDQFVYYTVPREYAMNGGEFSEELQEFTQDLCKERNLSYPLVLALIERETGYKNVDPNGCGSTGYMQIIQKWHEDRMEKFGVTDLLDPKGNIIVGIDYLSELFEKYNEVNLVLMAYNMGESGAKKVWEDGIYSSDYADYIIQREAEISAEIYGR